ncbi:MAG: hypothetical protein ACTSRZ_14750 [Promethearchaeota archaeon]
MKNKSKDPKMQNDKTNNLDDYLLFTPNEYARLFNLPPEQCMEIIEKIRSEKNIQSIQNLQNLNTNRANWNMSNFPKIPINSQNINSLTNGGFWMNKIYLIYGEFATGKSQFCYTTCISFFKIYSKMQFSSYIYFIDSENTFLPDRLKQIAESKPYSINFQDFMQKIKVVNISNLKILQNYIQAIQNSIINNNSKNTMILLIIDSITNCIRSEMAQKNYSFNVIQGKLRRFLEILQKIKRSINIFIILTSQVKSTPSTKLNGKFSIKPVFEHLLNEYCDDIIFLYKKENERYAYLINSINLKEKEIKFKISEEGISD